MEGLFENPQAGEIRLARPQPGWLDRIPEGLVLVGVALAIVAAIVLAFGLGILVGARPS